MRRKYLAVSAGVALLVAAGVGAWLWSPATGIPSDPDDVILFSVDGTKGEGRSAAGVGPKGVELLYGCPVLGKVEVADPGLRRQVVAAVNADIRAGHDKPNKCFWPRHVLRVVKGGTAVDVVICFECHNYELHRDGGPHPGLTPTIGESSKPMLNQLLADAGVPLAP